MPKRSRRSRDLGKDGKKKSEVPTSPARSVFHFVGLFEFLLIINYSSSRKSKSQVVEIPGRPQFAEGLPMFPIRSKKA